jgi:hypothetical protein
MAFFWVLPVSGCLVKIYSTFILSMPIVPNHEFLVSGVIDLPRHPEITVYVFNGSSAAIL